MDTTDVVWIAGLAGFGVAEVFLIRTGCRPLTASARERKWFAVAFAGMFGLHVIDCLGPLDPFKWAGHLIRIREE